jgi:hypothetical protein
MWVRFGIEQYGVPEQVIHFEYDTSVFASGWRPMMTWSLREFIVESVRDPSGIALGRDRIEHLSPNSLRHRVDMENILAPIMQLPQYPHGFQVLHEENVSIAQRYNIPSQFIYAYNIQTMDYLVNLYNTKHNVFMKDLTIGNNSDEPLAGEDSIGVMLQYPHKRVYYFNSIANTDVIGTNATYTQVAIGIVSALLVLLFDTDVKNQVYFVEDLFDSHYPQYLFDHMKVQEFVFTKEEKGYLLEAHTPQIKSAEEHYSPQILVGSANTRNASW